MSRVTILYFAGLREALGVGREEIDLPSGVSTAAELRTWLAGRGPAWAEAFAARRPVRIALDKVMVEPDAPLAGRHEIAFFPPVTGG